jgi:hypothetical protein
MFCQYRRKQMILALWSQWKGVCLEKCPECSTCNVFRYGQQYNKASEANKAKEVQNGD